MQYEDFDVSIQATIGRTYRIPVLRAPAGEAQEVVDFIFADVTLQPHLFQAI